MPISLYQASIPVCQHYLTALSAVLDKAAAHVGPEDEAQLAEARLAPDMLPLNRQVHLAADHAKFIAARLSGREPPRYEDVETTIDELNARIAKTLDFIASVEVAELEGGEDREITIRAGGNTLTFNGLRYLTHFALPNFFFHVTTAYDILRAQGVPIGKRDFLGAA